MPAINLMPSELKPKGYILKLSKALKKLSLAGLVVFLFSGILLVGAFVIVSGKLRASLSHQEELKSQIKASQQTEQSLLLTKDRLNKIEKIESAQSAKEGVGILDGVLKDLPEGVVFKEAELSPDVAEITVLTGSSSQLSKFLGVLKGGNYKLIELSSFIYKPNEGYEVKLSLVK